MSDKPAFTRRQFLTSSLAMVSTVGSVPTFLSNAASVLAADTSMRLSSKPGVPDERILVVVQLSGGNDGLNTVVPYGMREYHNARPMIRVNEKNVLPLDDRKGIGLNPSLAPLHEMVGEGLAAVVQGVGYPNPNRSHFASMDVWHTGDTRGGRGQGWIGKAFDAAQQDAAQQQAMQCICIGNEAPLAAQGKVAKPISFEKSELFRWAGRDLHPAVSQAYDQLHQGTINADSNDPASFIFRTACDAQVASAQVRSAVARKSTISFPNNNLGQQLRMVASMIQAELPTRVYYVAMGGFDTHANQPGQHDRLLRDFGQAMQAFYKELKAIGQSSRVTTMAFSEFGRRVRQNASGGTDHGTAGPLFMFGEHIKSGLLGTHPSLTRLDQGDLIYNLDFRHIYADVLGNWLKMDATAALGQAFKPAGIIRV